MVVFMTTFSIEKLKIFNELQKAVVSTPKDSESGRVDLSLLSAGDSAWITVTDSSSPLYGRPILITRTSDNQFALTGGGGPATKGKKHLILSGIAGKETKRDKELNVEVDKIKNRGNVLSEEVKTLTKEKKKKHQEASSEFFKALGINNVPSREEFKSQKVEIENVLSNQFESGGLSEEESQKLAKELSTNIMKGLTNTERKISDGVRLERSKQVIEVGKVIQEMENNHVSKEEVDEYIESVQGDFDKFDREIVSIDIPLDLNDIERLKNLTLEQQESYINNKMDKVADDYINGDLEDSELEETDIPKIDIGMSVSSNFDIINSEALKKTLNLMNDYYEASDAVSKLNQLKRSLPKVGSNKASNFTVNEMLSSIREASYNEIMSLDELESRTEIAYERWMNNNSAPVLYQIMNKYENEEISAADMRDGLTEGSTLKFNFDGGAVTALTALSKMYLESQWDTLKLVRNSSVELASACVALGIRNMKGLSKEQYNQIIDNLKEYNETEGKKTEGLAIERDKNLDRELQELESQAVAGDILDEVKIAAMKTDIIVRQLSNIGSAVGSLRASATVLNYLEEFNKKEAMGSIAVSIGSNIDDAHSLVDRLNLKRRDDYVIDNSDSENITVKLNLEGVKNLISKVNNSKKVNDVLAGIKIDTSNTEQDDNGNLIVTDHDVPFFNNQYIDDNGGSHSFNLRVEQRNGINWLLNKTEETEKNPFGDGGGLVNLTTGGGKTLIATGFFAHQIEKNPKYKGLIVVPKGRSAQWEEEGQRFTSLKMKYIPDNAKQSVVQDMIVNAEPGSVLIMSHQVASKNSQMLKEVQIDNDLKFNGITIDEPHELLKRGKVSGIGAAGKRLMQLPFNHRVGLTATPVQNSPADVHPIISWAEGGKPLGSFASFNRAWGGLGKGNNLHDVTGAAAYKSTIDPYVFGTGLTNPSFKTERSTVEFNSSNAQIDERRKIESESNQFVSGYIEGKMTDVINNPNHKWRKDERGKLIRNWRQNTTNKAKREAEHIINERHIANMEGNGGNKNRNWRDNSRFVALFEQIKNNSDKKQVIYISSKHQREGIISMFRDSEVQKLLGYTSSNVQNIASSVTQGLSGEAMANRVSRFRNNPEDKIILIDRNSSSGYNLQSGDAIHFIGDPETATQYVQAEGRIAREPREGDIEIKTYRNRNDLTELAKWDKLNTAIKVVQASVGA